MDLVIGDDHTKIFDRFLLEETFLRFQVEVIVYETLEDLLDRSSVFVGIGREDQDVIHIDDDLAGTDEISKENVHHGLESRRGVLEAEEHDRGFP
jgi:hypothetical protein